MERVYLSTERKFRFQSKIKTFFVFCTSFRIASLTIKSVKMAVPPSVTMEQHASENGILYRFSQ